jgi:lipopolysaccharide export system permease protein
MVAMSVPCATLVAPLMAFGRMAQDNEITALRAGGVNMFRIVRPALIGSVVMTVLLTLFNNHVLPESNHAFANLMIDISRKKPALELREGAFIHDLPGYSMLFGKVDQRTSELEHITIYELKPRGKPTTILARRGRLGYTEDGNTLTLELEDGEIHEVPDPRHPEKYRRMMFENHRIYIKGISSALQRTERDTRSDREMSTRAMLDRIDELGGKRAGVIAELDTLAMNAGADDLDHLLASLGEKSHIPWWQRLARAAGSVIRVGPLEHGRLGRARRSRAASDGEAAAATTSEPEARAGDAPAPGGEEAAGTDEGAAGTDEDVAGTDEEAAGTDDGAAPTTAAESPAERPAPVLSEVQAAKLRVKRVELQALDRRIQSFWVEVHKKFAIPVACIVFVLVGAPLGIRSRRGGVAMGFISVVFFIFYYICLIGGEQLADRSILPPWLAMWIANVVIGAIGILLTLRTMEVGKSGVQPAQPAAPYEEAA